MLGRGHFLATRGRSRPVPDVEVLFDVAFVARPQPRQGFISRARRREGKAVMARRPVSAPPGRQSRDRRTRRRQTQTSKNLSSRDRRGARARGRSFRTFGGSHFVILISAVIAVD